MHWALENMTESWFRVEFKLIMPSYCLGWGGGTHISVDYICISRYHVVLVFSFKFILFSSTAGTESFFNCFLSQLEQDFSDHQRTMAGVWGADCRTFCFAGCKSQCRSRGLVITLLVTVSMHFYTEVQFIIYISSQQASQPGVKIYDGLTD